MTTTNRTEIPAAQTAEQLMLLATARTKVGRVARKHRGSDAAVKAVDAYAKAIGVNDHFAFLHVCLDI